MKMKKLLIMAMTLGALAGCKAKVAKYEIYSAEMYFKDGKQCATYNVIVDKDLDEKNLARVYKDVLNTQADGLYKHTVNFYSNKDLIESGDYDIGEIVEESGNDYTFNEVKTNE